MACADQEALKQLREESEYGAQEEANKAVASENYNDASWLQSQADRSHQKKLL